MIPVGISYSGGTSSEWMIRAVIEGVIPRPKHIAVFMADTGDEHEWTYERAAMLEEACRAAGIPFFRGADRETLSESLFAVTHGTRTRTDTPPLWTENPGGGRGQLHQKCTKRFKTAVIRRMQSAWLRASNLPKRIESWIGFGNDEQNRANKAVGRLDVKWQSLGFPAIRMGASRAAQRADVERWTGSSPLFSMCVECPFKDPHRWRQTTPTDLRKAVQIDEAIRHGLEPAGIIEPCYLSDRLIPVERLVRDGDPQIDLPGFEAPGCDAGACFV